MSRDFLSHSWGDKPEQKAREKQYNAEYYRKHKDKWKKSKKNSLQEAAIEATVQAHTDRLEKAKKREYWFNQLKNIVEGSPFKYFNPPEGKTLREAVDDTIDECKQEVEKYSNVMSLNSPYSPAYLEAQSYVNKYKAAMKKLKQLRSSMGQVGNEYIKAVTNTAKIASQYIKHSWGNKPEQKAREKQHNAEYYRKHKDKWKAHMNRKGLKESLAKDKARYKQVEYWKKQAWDAANLDLRKEGLTREQVDKYLNDYKDAISMLQDYYEGLMDGSTQIDNDPSNVVMIYDSSIGDWREYTKEDYINDTKDMIDSYKSAIKTLKQYRSSIGQAENEQSKAVRQYDKNARNARFGGRKKKKTKDSRKTEALIQHSDSYDDYFESTAIIGSEVVDSMMLDMFG